jgi:hypothetical protein
MVVNEFNLWKAGDVDDVLPKYIAVELDRVLGCRDDDVRGERVKSCGVPFVVCRFFFMASTTGPARQLSRGSSNALPLFHDSAPESCVCRH